MQEKLYEITGIYDPDLSENDLQAEIENFKNLISKLDGKFAKSDVWGKIRLCYPVRKKTEGWFVTYYFKGSPALPENLFPRLKLNERLMRFLLVRSNDKLPEDNLGSEKTGVAQEKGENI